MKRDRFNTYRDSAKHKVFQLRLDGGEPHLSRANAPVLEFIPNGEATYLWVGNDGDDSKFCFGTVSAADGLRTFAVALLATIDGKPAASPRTAEGADHE
jgi:hypothetical protein